MWSLSRSCHATIAHPFLGYNEGVLFGWTTIAVLALALASPSPAMAQSSNVELYQKKIKPILVARCVACHGALKQESGLRLDTGAFARQGSSSGKILEASSRG